MLAILGSNEFWAALAGGALSLLGAFLSIWWQSNAQTRQRTQLVEELFYEQVRSIKKLTDQLVNIFQQNNTVVFHVTEQISVMVSTFNRNIEQLIFIKDRTIRDAIRDYIYSVDFFVQRMRYKQEEIYKIQIQAEQDESIRDSVNTKIAEHIVDIKNIAADLRNLQVPVVPIGELRTYR